jgi:hypothetical protein
VNNKKIKNATPYSFNGIAFKSKLEVMVYKTLLENNINANYERETFLLWEGFSPTIPFFTKDKRHTLVNNSRKLLGITYTPDFTFDYNGWHVVIEVKGFQNDVFPYKFKMFRKYLEKIQSKKGIKFILAEIFTKSQLLEFIQILKVYGKATKDN